MAKIGKNIIEIITSSMYDDPKTIYREYIQNAADSIDKAVETGLLKRIEDGEISISLDKKDRTILIEDNGTGIRQVDVAKILIDVADSNKDRDTDKGFYGIGRMTGLGFCKNLIFETSFCGENKKTRIIWDALKLREIINDKKNHNDAIEVLNAITTLTIYDEIPSKHYFKVILENVNPSIIDELLEKSTIRDYLRLVAPVPFDRTFQYFYNGKIDPFVKEKGLKLDSYNIYVDGEKIFKCYNTSIYDKSGCKSKTDEVKDLKFIDFKTEDGEVLAWGWHSISNFDGQIPNSHQNRAKGLRFRKHNIQIGNEDTLVKYHKEQRGNNYFFGEIHVVHKDLLPNSQRNDFAQNDTYQIFQLKLRERFQELFVYYQEASKIRSAFESIVKAENLRKDLKSTKALNNEQRISISNQIEKAESEAIKKYKEIQKRAQSLKENDTSSDIFKNIAHQYKDIDISPKRANIDTTEICKTLKNNGYLFDDLSALSNAERKLVSKVFSVIADNIPDKKLVEVLAIKVKDKFK